MNMTLVRGSLVGLLCMPVLMVGCGADPGTVGDVADNPGDMLDSSADVGPTQHELQLGRNIVARYMALTELRDPVTALEVFDLRDTYELAGLPREGAPNLMQGIGQDRALVDCLEVTGDTIELTSCPVGGVNIDGHLTLNFQTIDILLNVGGTLNIGSNSFSVGASLFGGYVLAAHTMDASFGTSMSFDSLTVGIGLSMVGLELAECGPTIGSLTFSITLGSESLDVDLPFNGCGG
jgi:hypothetical protein